ncbi:MAG: hypothetical protein QOE14_618 [Humisphaera sp.]|nr:hypothetical protein [Humisphaera sp.]
MESVLKRFVFILCAVTFSAASARVAAAAEIPPAVARPVDFQKEVVPIFQSSCVTCHSSGKTEADLSIETREKMLEGGASDPAIVPGKSADSLLIHLVSGQDPDRIMPDKGKRLTAEQIGILRAWIDQGAKWEPKDFLLSDPSKPTPAKLEPREVAIPAAKGDVTNPIDLLLEPYFAKNKIKPAAVVDDRAFARRVYLDIIGLLPPPAELEKFVADKNPAKRQALVRALLNDKPRYATHWLSFWNDLLRNDYKGTGYVDGGRKQITPWLYEALYNNMPYDQFVRELITGANGSDGFVKGIVWRGVVNAAQTPQMQAAQNISQVFMGVNLKCASCHDSFINQWKLTDSFGFASVYADSPLEMERCTKPLGQKAPVKFLYPQLGSIPQDLPKEKRVEALADLVTNKGNGRLTRTIVNRLWQRFMGRGLIEPVDEMDYKPWNADVLDALAWDLPKHYDLKKTIEMIVLSRAYQLPAVPADESQKEYVFAGPAVRRMTAEQFVDSVATVTGVWPEKPAATLSDASRKYARSKWIWNAAGAEKEAPVGKIFFRRQIQFDPAIETAPAVIAVDNTFELHINGKKIADGVDTHAKPMTIDLKPHLVGGKNNIRIHATNTSDKPNPAGVWFHLDVTYAKDVKGKRSAELVSNAKWQASVDEKTWTPAVELGGVNVAPWALAGKLPDAWVVDPPGEVRAALLYADSLSTALGRPNREQVNTVRPTAATTLQMLELTNGPTLAELLARGAKKLVDRKDAKADEVVATIYARAFGRAPTASELATAKEVIAGGGGNAANPQGVEDFLWALMMLPEFQLIR